MILNNNIITIHLFLNDQYFDTTIYQQGIYKIYHIHS